MWLSLKELENKQASRSMLSRFKRTTSKPYLSIKQWPFDAMCHNPYDDQSNNPNVPLQRCDLVWWLSTLVDIDDVQCQDAGISVIKQTCAILESQREGFDDTCSHLAHATSNLAWCANAKVIGEPPCVFVAQIYRHAAKALAFANAITQLRQLDRFMQVWLLEQVQCKQPEDYY